MRSGALHPFLEVVMVTTATVYEVPALCWVLRWIVLNPVIQRVHVFLLL